ncbi:MAG: Ig-like domain-containing protein [Ilumatobacteraceae bacterium]
MGVSKRKVLVITGTAAAAATPMVGAATAHAASFEVTNLNDSGAGSLRDALAQANALAGADVITFQSGLTGTITLTSGQIDITDSVTVQGPGATELTIGGNGASRIFYLYNSADTPIDVTISSLTFTDGDEKLGGAILADGENLTVEHSTFQYNEAYYGGGAIAFDTKYIEASGPVGELRIDDTVFFYNSAYHNGGAVFVDSAVNVVEITNSRFEDNHAEMGGAIFFDEVDNVAIADSVLTGNAARKAGGAIFLYSQTGDLDIVRTTIEGSRMKGGRGGGLFVLDGGDVLIDESTISNNSASDGAGVFLDYADSFEVLNSTISGNYAGSVGGGVYADTIDLAAEINHSTITQNSAYDGGGGLSFYNAALSLDHSIVSENYADSGNHDIEMSNGNLNADWSIIGEAGLVGGANNIMSTTPGLLPLADNGGPTETHMPDVGSPAIDAGDPAIVAPPEFDQRGADRIEGVIDIGSVEVGNPAVDDAYSVAEDDVLNVPAPGVLDNDFAGTSATVALVDGPAHGTLTFNSDGSFVYTPTADFHGSDTFQYSLEQLPPKKPSTDAEAPPLPTATVTITVNPVNDPPQAIGDTASVVAGVAKPVTVVVNDTDIDGDVLTITGVTQGSKGTVVINGNTIVYTPNNSASGADSFTYTISDGQSSSTATVTVNIIGGRIPATGQSSWELVFTATALLGAGFALRGAARRRIIG